MNKVLDILVKLFYLFGFIIIIACILCVLPYIFMLLWNYIMPLFGVIKITFIQAFAIVILINIISLIVSKNFKK